LDLPKALNATASDIQDRIQELIRQKSSEIIQVQDELVKVYEILSIDRNSRLSCTYSEYQPTYSTNFFYGSAF
jgi:hypothetical protein